MRLTHCYVTSVEMDKDGVFLTTAVLPLAIKYTVVARWRSPADGVAPKFATSLPCLYPVVHIFLLAIETNHLSFIIRESVDSLCRDGANAQYMQYLSKSRITSLQIR